MPRLETFSTAGLAVGRRLEYWNDLVCNTFTPIIADPRDLQCFQPSLARSAVGGVLLGEVHSFPSVVRHTTQHVAQTRTAMFFLHVQTDGRSCNWQDGREAYLDAGDFTLFDNTRPYRIEIEAPGTTLVVGIPDRLIRRHLARPENVVALPVRRCDPLAGLLVDMLGRLWALCNTNTAPLNDAVESALLNLIGAAYAGIPLARADGSQLPECRRLRIVRFVEEHLGDADLGPATIATALRMTPRNVHMTFSQAGETLSRYILRRRLEECARLLADPAHWGRKISDVAFDLGFSSLTHFGKVFHERFGMTASEYRQEKLREAFPVRSSLGTTGVA